MQDAVLKRLPAIKTLISEILKTIPGAKIKTVYLHRSRVRGNNREDSDIDIWIQATPLSKSIQLDDGYANKLLEGKGIVEGLFIDFRVKEIPPPELPWLDLVL